MFCPQRTDRFAHSNRIKFQITFINHTLKEMGRGWKVVKFKAVSSEDKMVPVDKFQHNLSPIS